MDNNSGTAPLQITINGQDFDVNEAQELIETGRKTREMEQRWNTKLDSVWPEYGRSREELKKVSEEKQRLEDQIKTFQQKQSEGLETPTDELKAKDAARKLGIALNEDLDKAGYIKKDTLDAFLEERDKKRDEQKRATDAVLAEADKLEKEISGSDGRPKFSKRLVLAYASAYGMNNLQQAYEDMYQEDLKSWKDAQIEKNRGASLKGLGTGGKKEPNTPRITGSNFRKVLEESLHGTE
jgi:DNA-directed RNA polymerase specialized sigma54-like protein